MIRAGRTLDVRSARAKLERAKEHVDELFQAIGAFLATEGAPVRTAEGCARDPSGTWWNAVLCVEITRQLPERWGLLAGDAVHNVRSALDHLVCALVRAAGNKPTTRTQFPIYEHGPTKRQLARLRNSLVGMEQHYADAVERVQPYLDPEAERSRLLVKLARLDNLDKHQLVNPVYALSNAVGIDVEPPLERPPDFISFNYHAPVGPGTPLLVWPLGHPLVKSITASFEYKVGFGSVAASHFEVRDIRLCVAEIIESFVRLDPPPH